MVNYRQICIIISIIIIWPDATLGQRIKEKPNVILFLVDDYGYGDIGFEGNARVHTPNIDRIATSGAHFTRFYQSSAACAPTRASVLTGRYHLRTGVWDVHDGRDFLHRDETTIAEVFKQAGYTTAAFGKWHSGKTNRYFSWNRGFDIGIHPKLYSYLNTSYIFNNKVVEAQGAAEDILGDEVVQFIANNSDDPFFAYVPIQSVHEPYNCPDDLFEKYKDLGHSDHVSRLYGMIELLDRNIGKILDAVEKKQLSENTLVMFLCDDGPSPGYDLSYAGRRMNDAEKQERTREWPRMLRGGKASIYEGGSVTPFYAMWKNHIPAGMQIDELSGIIDIFPTLVDACEIKTARDNLPLSGQSFWPLLQGETINDWDGRFYFDNTNFYQIPRGKINTNHPRVREISVHHREFKLIRFDRYHSGRDTVYYELYDLENDPGEKLDLSASEPALVNKLSTEIDRWFNSITTEGRAYQQAVYEIGDWNERATPINLDAYEQLSLAEAPEKTSFNIDGWIQEGSFIKYNLDVIKEGDYQIELRYDPKAYNSGAKFIAYTDTDTASIAISSGINQSTSETMHLIPGRQLLTIELLDAGNSGQAVERLRRLVVHHVPGREDGEVLLNPQFKIETNGQKYGPFGIRNSAADFMFNERPEIPVVITGRRMLKILTSVDNPAQIDRIIAYRNFSEIGEVSTSEIMELTDLEPGKFTLNIEFISKTGIRNSARAIIEII
ncbi:MAG: sulfatase-like hydrolase/transferase [Saprospiraceae bacterium]|nr:sulfatase-like hydrolase/transferase [Saprospiraceae bacterium]